MTDSDIVEIDAKSLQILMDFANTHGNEYASPDTYRALMDARDALGYDDPHPHMVWREKWGDKPELSD